jgi:hypothetical protein
MQGRYRAGGRAGPVPEISSGKILTLVISYFFHEFVVLNLSMARLGRPED